MRKKELIKKMQELEATNDYHKFYYDGMRDLVDDILVIHPELGWMTEAVDSTYGVSIQHQWNWVGYFATWQAAGAELSSRFKKSQIKIAADAIRKKNKDKKNKKLVKDVFEELGLGEEK